MQDILMPYSVIVKGRNSLQSTKELKDEINAWLVEQLQAGNLNGCWFWSRINVRLPYYLIKYHFSDLEDATLFRLRF